MMKTIASLLLFQVQAMQNFAGIQANDHSPPLQTCGEAIQGEPKVWKIYDIRQRNIAFYNTKINTTLRFANTSEKPFQLPNYIIRNDTIKRVWVDTDTLIVYTRLSVEMFTNNSIGITVIVLRFGRVRQQTKSFAGCRKTKHSFELCFW